MTHTIFLPDRGILPDTGLDCSAALQAVFDGISDTSDSICVHFKPGTYHVSHTVGLRHLKRLRVHGNRAKIVAHFDPAGPLENCIDVFKLEDCEDITLSDFTFDTDNPNNASGVITAIDRENHCADVRIFDEFPVTGYEHIAATNSCDEKGAFDYALASYHTPITEEPYMTPDGQQTTRLEGLDYDVIGNHLIRIRPGELSPDLHVGHLLQLRYATYNGSVCAISGSRRVTLKNMMIHASTGVGILVGPRSEDLTLDNFCICVPEGSRRLMASNVDGIHIGGLSGKLEMKNCSFLGLGDDPLNIHNGGARIASLDEGSASMVLHNSAHVEWGLSSLWASQGDTVHVYAPDTLLQKGSFVVDSFVSDENGVRMTYSGASCTLSEGDILANASYYASVHIDGCTMRCTRARGLLVQSQNVLIENSYVYGMSLAGMLFAPDVHFWGEVGPCRNVEIRNNVIEYCARIDSSENQGAIIFNTSHNNTTGNLPAGVHANISIHSNRFLDIPGSGIYVCSAKNVHIEDNVFSGCGSWNGVSTKAKTVDYADSCEGLPPPGMEYVNYDIVLVNCENVVVRGNVSDRGQETLQALVNCTDSRTGV